MVIIDAESFQETDIIANPGSIDLSTSIAIALSSIINRCLVKIAP